LPSPLILAVSLEGSRSSVQPAASVETATQSDPNRNEPVDRDADLVTSAISAPVLIDLNSATVAQLNALRGGALIGRAIVRGRPYTRPEDLLQKRVVRRSTYERVKDQITVR
jgi:DNA uptake protein ComE-like DNA-binding protein